METLSRRSMSGARLAAFRAMDAFALEAYRASRELAVRSGDEFLAREIRRAAARSGGALVGATAASPGSPIEQRCLERARSGLVEGRYYVFLARRLGLLDARDYRGLTARHDAALRELEKLGTAGSRGDGLD